LDDRKDNISPRYLRAHCQSRISQHADQSFVKELAKSTQERLFLKNFPTLQKIKNATYNPTQPAKKCTENDTETQYCQWFARTDGQNTRCQLRFCNSGGAVLRTTVKWLIKI
jgi:hypothetical protein